MRSPPFQFPIPINGSWTMLAYDGVVMGDGEREVRECFYQSPTTTANIIDRARFEASYIKCRMVKVRDGNGEVIYDGESYG